jgi:hypothetical protein
VVFGWRALRPPRVVFVIGCVSCNKFSHFRQKSAIASVCTVSITPTPPRSFAYLPPLLQSARNVAVLRARSWDVGHEDTTSRTLEAQQPQPLRGSFARLGSTAEHLASSTGVGGVVVGAVRGRRRGRVVRRRARLRWGVCLLLLLLLLLVQDAGHVDGCFGRSRAVPCWDGPVPRFERSGAGRLRLVPSPLRSRRASAMGPW